VDPIEKIGSFSFCITKMPLPSE